MKKEKWTFHHGCHRETLISRDTGFPEEFDTKEEAIQAYKQAKTFYKSIGYKIWFAYITTPTGEKIMLETNPYRS